MPEPYVPPDAPQSGASQPVARQPVVPQPVAPQPAAPQAAAPQPSLPFTIQRQEQSDWCWAAVAASISAYFNPTAALTQCRIATDVLHLQANACCASPADCNTPEMLQHALTVTGNLALPPFDAFPTFDSLKAHTDADNPVCARIQWEGGGGHFIVIDECYVSSSGEQIVHVADPLHGPVHYRYDEVVNGYMGAGSWTDTFLVTKKS